MSIYSEQDCVSKAFYSFDEEFDDGFGRSGFDGEFDTYQPVINEETKIFFVETLKPLGFEFSSNREELRLDKWVDDDDSLISCNIGLTDQGNFYALVNLQGNDEVEHVRPTAEDLCTDIIHTINAIKRQGSFTAMDELD